MKPLLITILLAAPSCRALNLTAVRASGTPQPHPASPGLSAIWNRFLDPLPTHIAPLCGNGRLDSLKDYAEAYPSVSDMHFVEERCDDGNRLDGDGCSAECTNMDAFTMPCPLQIDTEGRPIIMAGVLNSSRAFVLTKWHTRYLDPLSLAVISTASNQPPIENVRSVFFDGTSAWLYASGRVWDALNATRQSIALNDSASATWRTVGDALLLATAAGQLVNVRAGVVVPQPLFAPGKVPVTIHIIDAVGDNLYALSCTTSDGSSVMFELDASSNVLTSSPMTVEQVDPTADQSLWVHLFLKIILSSTAYSTHPATDRMPIYSLNAVNFFASKIDATQLAVTTGVVSPRSSITHSEPAMGIGDPLIIRFDHTLPTCNSTRGPCLLDIPLCYDVLAPNAYSAAAATRAETFFTALDAASNSSTTWDEAAAKATFVCSTGPIQALHQVTENIVNGALWIVRGAQVFEVGKRATQVRLPNGQCLPSFSGPCPDGQYSPPRGKCKPCAHFNASAPEHEAYAYKQRCPGRLAQDVIHMIIASNTLPNASIAAAFVHSHSGNTTVARCEAAVAGATWAYAYDCTVAAFHDPAPILRQLRAATDFLGQPTLRKTSAAGGAHSTTSAAGGAHSTTSNDSGAHSTTSNDSGAQSKSPIMPALIVVTVACVAVAAFICAKRST